MDTEDKGRTYSRGTASGMDKDGTDKLSEDKLSGNKLSGNKLSEDRERYISNYLSLDNYRIVKGNNESPDTEASEASENSEASEASETSENNSSKHVNTRFFAFLILTAIVILLAGMAFLKSKGMELGEISIADAFKEVFFRNKEQEAGINSSFGYDIKAETLLGASRDTLLKYTEDSITGLDKSGIVKWKEPFTCIEPIAASSGTYTAAADINGRKLCLIKGKNKVWEIVTAGNMVNVSVNQNGYTAAVHETEGSKGAITVYDPNGTEIFTKTYAKRYVLNAEITADNREVLVSTVDISGISAYSSFEIVDIFGNFKSGIAPIMQKLFPLAWLPDAESIAMAGEDTIALYSREGNEIWSANFRKVYSAGILEGGLLAAAVSQSSDSGAHVEVWDESGKRFSGEPFGEGIVSMRCYDNIIGVNTGREAVFLDTECRELCSFSPTADILDLQFLNRREIAVITRNSINIYDLGVVK